MLGWLQMLRTNALPAEKREHALATVERNARAQSELVEDLLDVSSIRSGTLRLDMRQVRLADAVEAALESVRLMAHAKGVHLHVAMDPDAGNVDGDARRLQQIVWNLVDNAVKFTPDGGEVRLDLQGAGDWVDLSVTDTGEGIAPEFLPHVFDPFRQAAAGSARPHGGLGLGLAIVRHLTELHGGTVTVTSAGRITARASS